MATRAARLIGHSFSRSVSWIWLREFLRWELAPYPGRTNTVIRMTISTTLVMLIVVTFRIPNAFLAALFSILLARENLAVTWRGGRIVVIAFVAASLYILVGMMLFRGYPITHFIWVIGSLFLIFFVIRTMTNYAAAAAFAIPIGVTLPLWDRSLPSQAQVEGTLWPVLIIAIGAGVTVGTEALYRIFDRSDPLITFVDDVLFVVQQIVESHASHQAPSKTLVDHLLQYQMIGTGRLRVTLQRQGLGAAQRATRGSLISLVARLIGLTADLERTPALPSDTDSARLQALSERLAGIRIELRESGTIPRHAHLDEAAASPSFAILQEMERIVALMADTYQRDEAVNVLETPHRREWWQGMFLADTFHNPEYLRFAFAGCLSASVCYVLYNALDWPGIYISVLTCIVTALSTIGNSIQAQFLRLAGFVAGGLVLGISAQILILPSLDTVFGFALFFAMGTAIAAWFATSSPRLSFFGVQMALSFFFVNLQDPHIQTDLTIVRDKIMGVLLGILVMGFIFDRFGTKSDAEQLQISLVRNIKMLAKLGETTETRDRSGTASQIPGLRSQINDNFANLESQMDAARFEFEFRHRSEKDNSECQRIQRIQPWLWSIFLLKLSLLSHRGKPEIDSDVSWHETQALETFLKKYNERLVQIAAWLAREEIAAEHVSVHSIRQMLQTAEDQGLSKSQAVLDICQKMVSSLLELQSAAESC